MTETKKDDKELNALVLNLVGVLSRGLGDIKENDLNQLKQQWQECSDPVIDKTEETKDGAVWCFRGSKDEETPFREMATKQLSERMLGFRPPAFQVCKLKTRLI